MEGRGRSLGSDDLPALHEAASKTSRDAQGRFLRGTAAQLLLSVAAALVAGVGLAIGNRIAAAQLAGFFLILAALIRGLLLATRSERDWYDGRAAAESAKTLAWKYSVGGLPFSVDEVAADELFIQRLMAAMQLFKASIVAGGNRGTQITDAMKRLRAAPLDLRRTVYDKDRLAEQYAWYSYRSEHQRRQAFRWNGVVLVAQTGGAAAALLVAGTADLRFLIGAAAALAAAGTAWLQTKQFDSTGRAYAVAAQELAAVRSLAPAANSEAAWATFVDDAEEAISREHTTWRARRGA